LPVSLSAGSAYTVFYFTPVGGPVAEIVEDRNINGGSASSTSGTTTEITTTTTTTTSSGSGIVQGTTTQSSTTEHSSAVKLFAGLTVALSTLLAF